MDASTSTDVDPDALGASREAPGDGLAPEDLAGRELCDPSGTHIGVVTHVLLDADTDIAQWFLVSVGVGGGHVDRVVPTYGAVFDVGDKTLFTLWDREHVLASPVDHDSGAVTRVAEDQLAVHYGIAAPRTWINTGIPGGVEQVGLARSEIDAEHSTLLNGTRPPS